MTLAEGKRKVGVHQRPLTLDAGVNRDGSEGEGVSNKIEDTAGIVNVPNGFAREHAAAGWPSWLVSVAGEAVKGWLPRKANSFEKLYKVQPSICTCSFNTIFDDINFIYDIATYFIYAKNLPVDMLVPFYWLQSVMINVFEL